MQEQSEPQSTGRGSKSIRKKNTTAPKKKTGCSGGRKSTIFLATTIIEGANNVCTRLGRELDENNFRNTYEKLNKLYEELN
jgi:hypothetical protein